MPYISHHMVIGHCHSQHLISTSALGPSVAKIRAFKCIPPIFFCYIFYLFMKNETQITYLIQYGWYDIALATI